MLGLLMGSHPWLDAEIGVFLYTLCMQWFPVPASPISYVLPRKNGGLDTEKKKKMRSMLKKKGHLIVQMICTKYIICIVLLN